jgi:hypothetical protein
MYEAFDSFIAVETWHTRHPSDEERFYIALSKVVWSKDFSAEQMAGYLRKKLKLSSADHESDSGRTIDRYTQDAWAVRDFLKYNDVPPNS